MTKLWLLPRANEVCEGYVFTAVCLSTGGGGLGLCPGGLCPGGKVSVHPGGSLFRGVSVQGDLCPGRSLSRGLCPGRSLSRGGLCPGEFLSWGVSVQVGPLSREGSQSGGLCRGGGRGGRGTLSRGIGRAVRILLECIVVLF